MRNASAVIFFLWVMALVSASRADGPFTTVSVDGHKGYIIPAGSLSYMDGFFKNELSYGSRYSGLWTPTADEVSAAEQAAWKLVEGAPSDPVSAFPYLAHCKPEDKAKMWKNAKNEAMLVNKHREKYDGQFVGVVIDGEKQIFCNFFIQYPDIKLDPSTRLIDVNDGGYSYWQVNYDVASKTCLNLQINGPWELDW